MLPEQGTAMGQAPMNGLRLCLAQLGLRINSGVCITHLCRLTLNL